MFYFGSETITSRELQHCTPIYTHDLSSVKFCRLFFAKWIKCPTHFNFDAVDGDGLDQMFCNFSPQNDFKESTNRNEARFEPCFWKLQSSRSSPVPSSAIRFNATDITRGSCEFCNWKSIGQKWMQLFLVL